MYILTNDVLPARGYVCKWSYSKIRKTTFSDRSKNSPKTDFFRGKLSLLLRTIIINSHISLSVSLMLGFTFVPILCKSSRLLNQVIKRTSMLL